VRLLQRNDAGEFSLTRDLVGDDTIPPYAILSHTWDEDEEVTLADILDGTGKSNLGMTSSDSALTKLSAMACSTAGWTLVA